MVSNIGNVFFILFSIFCFVFCGLVWAYDGRNKNTEVPSYKFLNEIRQLVSHYLDCASACLLS